MKIVKTEIEGLLLLEPRVFSDDRGYFFESWTEKLFRDNGLDIDFVQDNESQSARGTLRGVHMQIAHPQGKLVRVSEGEVYDVAVDCRPQSKTLGKWLGFNLSASNKNMLWIPPGFGHAFLTLSERATFNYKCSELYFGDDQFTLAWDDSDIGIDWPIEQDEIQLSDKDQKGFSFDEIMKRIKQQSL